VEARSPRRPFDSVLFSSDREPTRALLFWFRFVVLAVLLAGASPRALAAGPQPARVTQPVPGLYAGIERTKPSDTFHVNERPQRRVSTPIPKEVSRFSAVNFEKYMPGGGPPLVPHAFTHFYPLTKKAEIHFARGREGNWYSPETLHKEVSSASLLVLKSAGVRYGGLRQLSLKAPVDDAEQHIDLARQVAEHSGHRVLGVYRMKESSYHRDAEDYYVVNLRLEALPSAPPANWAGQAIDGPTVVETRTSIRRAQPTTVRATTRLSDGNAGGHLTRDYEVETKTLRLEEAFLASEKDPTFRVPSWIPHDGVGLQDGKTPTVIWGTLRQMKALGIPYGGLRTLVVPNIVNKRSRIDLAAVRSGQRSMSRAIRDTQTYQYAETILTQSGHRIVGVSINYVPEERFLASTKANSLFGYRLTLRVAPLGE